MEKRTLRTKILRRLATYADVGGQAIHKLYRSQELRDRSLSDVKAIHTHMTTGELDALYDLAANIGASKRVLEIGSYLGASSCYLAAALSVHGGHLYCVDTWENQTMPDGERDTFAEFQRNVRHVAGLITQSEREARKSPSPTSTGRSIWCSSTRITRIPPFAATTSACAIG
jgi:hypothetical protein